MIDIVKENGPENAAHDIDIVTTGTFAPMCSSGAFINFGHSHPPIKASEVLLNKVPAYGGIAAVDCYLGATEPCMDDPLNKAYPGEFNYGGGHVIQDLVSGKRITLQAKGYGTDCYPNRAIEKKVKLNELPMVTLTNPRNAYQNYNCAINTGKRTIYTYLGVLKPNMGNANYCSAGQLSPLFNDPLFKTIGIGTRIFLGGGIGYVTFYGTQHNTDIPRASNDTPMKPAGTLFVMGDLKQMDARWLVGISILGYGCSLAVGLGIPIPILNEDMAKYTSVSDDNLYTQIVDYCHDQPAKKNRNYGQISYAELKSGEITVSGKKIPTVPMSSMIRAREIAEILKKWIQKGTFSLGISQQNLI
ncbi:MAG: cytoplasmic protein [Candidatus Magnetoglobus multicellularis str. Araruama]|uniref:Cytoplasmic protein n=1 Tax=Candidatus Magnetoglobus multicellularis str. Araruama TaxID=890399 RepID=A0A1V1P835_9BACT|nr:MAG: cytoplasmic protein [Candidatus Magnetoglobus multicellularis str. Araruama]